MSYQVTSASVPVPGHHAETGRVVLAPADRHLTLHGQLEVEDRRQVHEDHVVLGHVEVVHHRRPADGDGLDLHQLAGGRDPQVGEVRLQEVVAERQQLAGDRAELRVGGERALQLPAEVERADRLELVVEAVREVALLQRQRPAGVTE